MGGLGNQELPLSSPFSYNGYRDVPEKKESKGSAEMVHKIAPGDVAIFLYTARSGQEEKVEPPPMSEKSLNE